MANDTDNSNNCNETGLQAWLTLMRVYEKMQKHAGEHLHCFDLSPAQYDVLAQLHEAPGVSQQELAERLMVTKGNVCTLIDRMEKRGLVERRADPEDRRLHPLYLTEIGEGIATKAVPAYAQFVREHLSVLSPEEQIQMLATLSQLDYHLEAH